MSSTHDRVTTEPSVGGHVGHGWQLHPQQRGAVTSPKTRQREEALEARVMSACPGRLAAQDTARSRRQHRFESGPGHSRSREVRYLAWLITRRLQRAQVVQIPPPPPRRQPPPAACLLVKGPAAHDLTKTRGAPMCNPGL